MAYKSKSSLMCVIGLFFAATFLGCSDPKKDLLPDSDSKIISDSRYRSFSKTDQLALLRYYSRRNAFAALTPIEKGVTIESALAEQRRYESINLTATPEGPGIVPTRFAVSLHTNNSYPAPPIVGISGTIFVIDEYGEILLSQSVRVDAPEHEYRLALLWLPMDAQQQSIITKINRDTLGVCFQSGLKVKTKSQKIETVDFPLCYNKSRSWKLSSEELLDISAKRLISGR